MFTPTLPLWDIVRPINGDFSHIIVGGGVGEEHQRRMTVSGPSSSVRETSMLAAVLVPAHLWSDNAPAP